MDQKPAGSVGRHRHCDPLWELKAAVVNPGTSAGGGNGDCSWLALLMLGGVGLWGPGQAGGGMRKQVGWGLNATPVEFLSCQCIRFNHSGLHVGTNSGRLGYS